MKSGSYSSILKIVLHGRSAGNILLATLLSFTFSIAVILCTFGLMDGFDHLLKTGLRHSSGDLLITSRKGFFPLDEQLRESIQEISPRSVAPMIQTEAFALADGKSKGVLVRGIESRNFSAATGLKVKLEPEGIVIGKELARQMKLDVGSEIALVFGRGHGSSEVLPSTRVFKVSSIIEHGIYQKDLRFVYLNRAELAEVLEVGKWINLIILSTEDNSRPLEDLNLITRAQNKLRAKLSSQYYIRPFWSEYSFLIEAVKVEKFSISLILQLIVVVAVFNIVAFVIYIMEKKAQDFFFLRAVGLNLKSLMKFWLISVIIIWSLSCAGAHLLAKVFNWSLKNLSYFQIPGEIYVLSSLSIRLDTSAYVTVYSLALAWIILAAFIGYWRLKRRPIIQGLRQEFS